MLAISKTMKRDFDRMWKPFMFFGIPAKIKINVISVDKSLVTLSMTMVDEEGFVLQDFGVYDLKAGSTAEAFGFYSRIEPKLEDYTPFSEE